MYSLSHFLAQRLRRCALLACLVTGLALPARSTDAAPIDEFRLSDIEQKIRELEKTTREQARLIAQLQAQVSGNRGASTPAAANVVPTSSEQRWLNADAWARLKLGMNEQQVIELLGIPTQIRVSNDGQMRSLLYAMEIGRSGFLSGKVDLQYGKASGIEVPHLH